MLSYKECPKMLRYALAALALLFVSVACEKGSGDDAATAASFRFSVVDCETTINQLLLSGSASLTYRATIVEGSAWLSFTSDLGTTIKTGEMTPVVFVYLQRNTTPDDRTAVVAVEFSNGDTYQVTLTQQKYSASATYDKPWAEQPEFKPGSDLIYKTYFTTLNGGKYARNYTICYDRTKKVSQWVAYPLHTVYTTPSVGRTDAWSYDPNTEMPVIPQSEQQYILRGYGVSGYDRGHQLPSADRYSTISTNEMTFYATNMMPQASRFNQGIWGDLETRVRANMVRDTLYVVTGAYFGDSKTITDRGGNVVGVPSNCWKVLLRTKSGDSGKRIQDCTADELMGIGFWFSNDTSNSGAISNYAKSIAEIERLTGFSFFHNLPDAEAKAVKEQNDAAEWRIQ